MGKTSTPQIEFGEGWYTGAKDLYEDCSVQKSFTARNMTLSILIIADGAGGAELGERAARVGVEEALTYIEQNWVQLYEDIVELLRLAGEAAQRAVLNARRDYQQNNLLLSTERMYATLVMAAIVSWRKAGKLQHRLYVGNAGDSQIYVFRNGILGQFTRDHSNPANGDLENCLGVGHGFYLDTGIHYDTDDDLDLALQYGSSGFDLRPGDAVLVCSDGLTKFDLKYNRPPVTQEQIIKALRSNSGDGAARALVGLARGNDAYDNVTVLTAHIPVSAWKKMAVTWIPRAIILLVAIAMIIGLITQWSKIRSNAALITEQQEQILAFQVTQTVMAYTGTQTVAPPATATPRPTQALLPMKIAYSYDLVPGGYAEFGIDDVVGGETSAGLMTVLNREVTGEPAHIYLGPETKLYLTSTSASSIRFFLYENGTVFIQPGSFLNGVTVTLREDPRIEFQVKGSCMAVSYIPNALPSQVVVMCYSGYCDYGLEIGGARLPIPEGMALTLDIATHFPMVQQSILEAEPNPVLSDLLVNAVNRQDAEVCRLAEFVTATTPSVIATPTPVPAPIPNTPATPVPTPSPSNESQTITEQPVLPEDAPGVTVPPGENASPLEGTPTTSQPEYLQLPLSKHRQPIE